jgi:hypothetical protein
MTTSDVGNLLFWLGTGVVAILTATSLVRWRSGRPEDRLHATGGALGLAGIALSEVLGWNGWLLISCVGVLVALWSPSRGSPLGWIFGVDPWQAYDRFSQTDTGTMTGDEAIALLATLEGRVRDGDSELVALLREEYRYRLGRLPGPGGDGARSDWRQVRIHELAAARWPERVTLDRDRAERRWRLLVTYRILLEATKAGDHLPGSLAAALAELPAMVDPEEIEMAAFLARVTDAVEAGRPLPPESQTEYSRDLNRRVWPRPAIFAGAVAGPWPPVRSDPPTS